MKIYLANASQQNLGGGWSWIDNIRKAIGAYITDDYNEATVYLIPSPSMVQRDEVQQAKADGKKIVLRIDNAVRNSRNRNTGMSRMKDFAQWADLVVYQSTWARNYLMPFTGVDGPVINNSVDESVFNPTNRSGDGDTFLYSRINRDETKNWEVARYLFAESAQSLPARLLIAGNFSQELVDGNFDFYNEEAFRFFGPINSAEMMAGLYKQTDTLLYTFFNDACSNTLIEALMCGVTIDVRCDYYLSTGGAPEIMHHWRTKGADYFKLGRMGKDYLTAIEAL